METTSAEVFNGQTTEAGNHASSGSSLLNSPFAQHELSQTDAVPGPDLELEVSLESPFTDSYLFGDSEALDSQALEMLISELEDEEFTEALEALAEEAASRYMTSPASWNHELGVPVLDPTDAEQWVEAIGERADQLLAELEQRFIDRSVESVTDEELDEALEMAFPELEQFGDPLDVQDLFFGKLKKKLKKIARGAKNIVKKGIKLASKVLPLGIIYRRLRPIIKPLLKKVLASAIGRLPRSLREPARQLAQKYGLKPASEFETEFEYFATEFDMSIAGALTDPDPQATERLESEAAFEASEIAAESNIAEELDIARERLVQQLLEAEPDQPPLAAMEQFIPLAILPIVKTGISLIGRTKVVNFIAGLLARLIQPVVGRQLAKPLSVQIADKGLSLLKLEAEGEGERLGAEAIAAAVEETVSEIFSMPDELLENELYVEAAVQDAFHRSAARHIPGAFLRREIVDPESEKMRGVWVMMPRNTSPIYRYKKYSRVLPLRLTREMAREVVFSDGETLEERLIDGGETAWPVDVEVEAYDLLPLANLGHLASFETDGEYLPSHEAALEFDVLEEAGELPLPPDSERSPSRGRKRPLIRVRARGRRLRRKSPVSVRMDLSGSQPAVRLHVWVGERRAHAMSEQLQKQQHREVISSFKAITGPPMRRVVAKRLRSMFTRRNMSRDEATLFNLTNQVFDGLVAALSKQLPTMAVSLATAAKDPAVGLTVTAVFAFESQDAIGKGSLGSPTLTVRPGKHRD